MPLRPLVLPLLALGLACASSEPRPTPATPAPTPPADAGISTRPATGTDPGIDVAAIDRSVPPGNDFFLYANGTWLKNTEIPDDQSRWGTFNILNAESLERTRALLEETARSNAPAGSEERKLGDFYASYLDEATMEARGLAPLRPQLTAIAAIRTAGAGARAWGRSPRPTWTPLNATYFHTSRLFGLWVAPDMNQPAVYTGYLFQGGLGMPDREYYVSTNPKMVATRGAVPGAHRGGRSSWPASPARSRRPARILDLETRMAQVHASRADSFEVRKANNPWKRSRVRRRAPGLDWKTVLRRGRAAGPAGDHRLAPGRDDRPGGPGEQVPLATWKEWLTFHAIDRAAPLLTRAFVDERFEFYGKTLGGSPS